MTRLLLLGAGAALGLEVPLATFGKDPKTSFEFKAGKPHRH